MCKGVANLILDVGVLTGKGEWVAGRDGGDGDGGRRAVLGEG